MEKHNLKLVVSLQKTPDKGKADPQTLVLGHADPGGHQTHLVHRSVPVQVWWGHW